MTPKEQALFIQLFEKVAVRVFRDIPDGQPLPCTKYGIGKPQMTRKERKKTFFCQC